MSFPNPQKRKSNKLYFALVTVISGLALQSCDSGTSTITDQSLNRVTSASAIGINSGNEVQIASASSPDDHDESYSPSRSIDGNLGEQSRWSSNGTNQQLILDLGQIETVSSLSIVWYKGDQRTSYFDIDTSTNGSNWQSVLTGGTATGSGFQNVNVRNTGARYVRIVGKGNSDSSWNSIIEAKVFSPSITTDEQSCTRLDSVNIERAFSDYSNDADYTPSKAIDGNLNTESRWSSLGLPRSIVLDLGSASTVRSVSTAWYKANVRTAFFDVETSLDNNNWQTVMTSGSVSGTQGLVDTDVEDSVARYVRIVGQGNSESLWNSLIEAKVLGCGITEQPNDGVGNPPQPPENESTDDNTEGPDPENETTIGAPASNAVFNSTFENNLSGWSQVEPASGSGDAYQGQGSAKITSSGSISQNVFLVPGSRYRFSAWLQGNPTAGINIGGQTYSEMGRGTDSSFNQVTFEFTTESADSGQVFVQASSSADSQRVDNIEVVKISDNDGDIPVDPNSVFDFSIWDVEGEVPVNRQGLFEFKALEQCVITPNGNGCRHEQKIQESDRYGLTEQYERFAANIQPFLSDGSETIVAQHHPEATGTLSALYVSDRRDGWDNVENGVASDGIFDVVATVRIPGSNDNESVVFGTIESGDTFSYEVINDHGVLTMTALGKTYTVTSADSSSSYFKFGNYQQARDPESGERINLPKPHDEDARALFLDYYRDFGLTVSNVVFRNVEYFREID